jgi:hypothetical protein
MVEGLISPFLIPLLGSTVTTIATLFVLTRLPKDFKQSFGPAIYLIPIASGWWAYQFFNWLYYLNTIVLYLLLAVTFVSIIALMFASVKIRNRELLRNIRQTIQINNPPTRQIASMASQTVLPTRYSIHEYYNAPLIQNWDNGGGWRPTSIVPIDKSAPLTKDWITIDIDIPERVKPADILILKVDIINNHPKNLLYDKGVLQIIYPNGTIRGYGPDLISIEPNGEMATYYYTWKVPLFSGRYFLRYFLFNSQLKTERVLVVE